MKKMWKGILSLFVGIAIISCAGTNSSAEKKGEEKLNLVKAGTPAADSLVSGMTEFARSIFKGTLDSAPGDYYYHDTYGRIDTLFKKEGGQYKPIISIAYDFLIGQSNFELKKGNYSFFVKDGILEGEIDFPKHAKTYWNDGSPKNVLAGLLYRDDQGGVWLDSGNIDTYSENGKKKGQSIWKNKQAVADKQWNENGVLICELNFPYSYKEYWDNGNSKQIMTGILYKDDQGVIQMDSGRVEMYFENGKIRQQNEWKDKQIVAVKEWNENGVLTKEVSLPTYYKEYWDNGKQKGRIIGILYKNDQDVVSADSGYSESYFENEKIYQHNEWKDKKIIAQKEWNENGVLVKDTDFPKYSKEYWDNGKLKQIFTGILHRKNDLCSFSPDSGHSELFFENGKIKEQTDWRDKQAIASKIWNENGVLIKDIDYPKHYKEYWDNGKPKFVSTGLLYRNDLGNFDLDSGHQEIYFENGKIKEQSDWKNKQFFTSKRWIESGVQVVDLDFPKYLKQYWDNGKPKQILTGLLYRDDQGNIQIKSGQAEIYFENGKIKEKNEWKDRQGIASKQWNEKGTLIKEIDFPKSYKEYWDNGKPKGIMTGILYRDDQGGFRVDSGHSETYFENGKIKQKNDWKDKQPVASRQWNEMGVLIKEIDFPKSYKEYWDNRKPKGIMTGNLYRDDQGNFHIDSGHSETYFENGKINQQNDWKNKLLITQKEWNESGTLTKELDFPKYFKDYWNNGKIRAIGTGLLYRDAPNNVTLDSGLSETYFENGKIKEQNNWKDKQVVASRVWNENEVLIKELEFPKYAKEYWDNGNIKEIVTGPLHRDGHGGFYLETGHKETYFENGKIKVQSDWKDNQLITKKQWNENGILIQDYVFPKYHKEYWDNGKMKQTAIGLLYRNAEGGIRVDSGHSEIYFENGKINEQNNWKDKQVVASKVWNENGVLIKDLDFPKHLKEYWDNGNIRQTATGILYRDNQGSFHVDSGHSEIYFENGKIHQKNDWKDKQGIASKQWNEDGVLIKELDIPKYYKEYWDNGNPKGILTGIIYRNSQGNYEVDSGHAEIYFENGKIKEKSDWKNKQGVAIKQWTENGVLVKDIYLPKHLKENWDNGKTRQIAVGTLYRTEQGDIRVDSGQSEIYFEDGKINEQNKWKNKQGIAHKEWNESGILLTEINFPKYLKMYWDNGNPRGVMTGLLYRDNQGTIRLDSGHEELYFENGKISQQNDWKNKQPVASKQWNENGTMIIEFKHREYYTEYWDNGNPKNVMTGIIYRDNQGVFQQDSGRGESYFENGKIESQFDKKDKQIIAGKQWDENGTLKFDLDFPKYQKLYSDSGILRLEMAGTLFYDDNGKIQIQNGFRKIYYENGEMGLHEIINEKKLISKKSQREDGTLSMVGDVQKGVHNEYYSNGKPSREISGKFHYDDDGDIVLENASDKWWNEKGILIVEIVFPKYWKNYYGNGNIKTELEGSLYYDDQNKIQLHDGFRKEYYDNGKMAVQKIYKEKKLVGEKFWDENGTIKAEGDISRGIHKGYFPNGKISVEASGKFHYDGNVIVMENGTKKWWYENGNLEYELVFPKYEKKYSDNGTLAYESEGTLYYDDKNEIQVQDGFKKEYSDSGKLATQKNYNRKKIIGKTVWNENGIVTISVELPNHYREFYDDGKIKAEATGTIVEEDDSFRIKDGTYKEYDLNGKVTYIATYEDFQRISEK